MPGCYQSELGNDVGRCDRPAEYVATLTWSNQLWFLCRDHLAEEREADDVLSCASLPVEVVEGG